MHDPSLCALFSSRKPFFLENPPSSFSPFPVVESFFLLLLGCVEILDAREPLLPFGKERTLIFSLWCGQFFLEIWLEKPSFA